MKQQIINADSIEKKPPVPIQIKLQKNFSPKLESENGDEIKITIEEIKNFNEYSSDIANVYMGEMSYYSTTLDIITIYLKGQKLMYMESKTYCEMCLYFLMLPAIFISACCTVLSISLKSYAFGSVIVSGLTALNSFILGIVTYLKLDAKSEAHKTTTYQFDKLQTQCEFYSGKTLMIRDDNLLTNIKEFYKILEKKVSEIKDVNQFPIPEYIRKKYGKIYGQNVFSEMKRYKTIRSKNIQKLIIIDQILEERKNKPEYIPVHGKRNKNIEPIRRVNFFKKSMYNLCHNPQQPDQTEEVFVEVDHPDDNIYDYSTLDLKLQKEKIIQQILEYRNLSIKMNEIFDEQLKKNEGNKNTFCKIRCCCTYFCLKT